MSDERPLPPDSGTPPRLTVVIVNYNGWPDVACLVASLASSGAVRAGLCEVIVVDNASDAPAPPDLIRPGVRLIPRPDNGGFAVGVNAGWRASRSPWLLLLNPDIQADRDFLDRVMDRIDHHEQRAEGAPGIVGFALANPDGSRQPSVGAEPGLLRSLLGPLRPRAHRSYRRTPRAGPVPWATGACLLVDAQVMQAAGGMDEDFFLYYEEVALCRSARTLGRRVEFDDQVSAVHLRPLQNRSVSPRMRVIVRHAKLLFFRKHLARWQYLALQGIVAIEAVIRGRWAAGRGRPEEARAWRAIGKLTRMMRQGQVPKGREVLALAGGPSTTDDCPHAPRLDAAHTPNVSSRPRHAAVETESLQS